MFTIVESQLNSDFPGEEKLGKLKEPGLFLEGKEGDSVTEGGQGRTRTVDILVVKCLSFGFFHCEKAKAEKFIQVTSIDI